MKDSVILNFSEKDIDFSSRASYISNYDWLLINYDKFLINEFFNATNDEILEIMRAYRKSFGQSAFDYAMKHHFNGWRNGDRTLSYVQRRRILSIMPALLNEAAKQKIEKIKEEATHKLEENKQKREKAKEEARYKLGIDEVLNTIKNIVQSFYSIQGIIYSKQTIISVDDIINIIQKEIERANALEIVQKVSRFNSDKIIILTEDEKDEVLRIAKYIVFVKLQKQINQIEKDFNTFLPFLKVLKGGIFKAVYNISIFNIKIEITDAKFTDVAIPHFTIKEIETNSRYKEYSDKYLAHELININSETNRAISNAFLNAHDIKMFIDYYSGLSNSDSEINMISTFTGEGGVLNLEAQMKPIKMLKTSIAKSTVRILIYTIVIMVLISWFCIYKLWVLLFLGGLFGSGFYFSVISGEIKQIKTFKSEIKKYG